MVINFGQNRTKMRIPRVAVNYVGINADRVEIDRTPDRTVKFGKSNS
jgi:hypothetical protein